MWNKLFILFGFFLLLAACQKKEIKPVDREHNCVYDTKSTRDPGCPGDEDGGGITDPDDESEDDKIKNKKKKAK